MPPVPARKIDPATGEIVHTLFALRVSREEDPAAHRMTMEVLGFLQTHAAAIRELGLHVKTKLITKESLVPEVREAFRRRGITNLPALVSHDDSVYLGVKEITDIYTRNFRESDARGRRGDREVAGHMDEDESDLDRMYRAEMREDRIDKDRDDDDLGEGRGDFAAQATAFMERRMKATDERAGRKPAAAPAKPAAGTRTAAPRRDNVAAAPVRRRPINDEDDDDLDLIDRLAQDIDDDTRGRAMAGGTAYDDDEGDGAADEMMERAFYGRSAISD